MIQVFLRSTLQDKIVANDEKWLKKFIGIFIMYEKYKSFSCDEKKFRNKRKKYFYRLQRAWKLRLNAF